MIALDTDSILETVESGGNLLIRRQEDLSRWTTFKIGGKARFFIEPSDDISLKRLLRAFDKHFIPWRVIGAGSNILVNDQGIDDPVISLRSCRNRIEILSENLVYLFEKTTKKIRISIGAGVSLKKVLGLCIKMGWSGCEFLAGIPATVGGAVFMNAGTSEGSMSHVVSKVELMNPSGEIYIVPLHSLSPCYRSLGIPPDHIVLGVEIELVKDHPKRVFQRIRSNIFKRKRTQPLIYPSAGCIFKNPLGGPPAGWLIDQCGLKGYRVGNAQISPVHANWIINLGGATAVDVIVLIEHIKEKVFKRFGILLEEEIKLW
ncbi:MAG: UDP-N-acetylmuramate dehydrogenase [Syntrophobacterales bacterium]|nr:UDP-N-acetylmuramate dehydrogenase [Syntrophobacterales bacterium]